MSGKPGYAFYLDVFGSWRWEYYDRDGEATDCRQSFDTRQECVDDARAFRPRSAVLSIPAKPAPVSHDGGARAAHQATRKDEQQTSRAA